MSTIDTMTAPEIDRAVAVEVMGYTAETSGIGHATSPTGPDSVPC